MPKSKKRTFTVSLRLIAVVDHEIQAESMEEALSIAAAIGPTDAYEQKDSIADHSVRVCGIYSSKAWDTDQE